MNRQALQSQLAAFHQKLIEDEKSPATIDKYCRDIAVFLEFAGEAELGKELVIAYKNHLLEHYAPNSVNSMLTAPNTTRIYTCLSGAEQQRQIEKLGLVI